MNDSVVVSRCLSIKKALQLLREQTYKFIYKITGKTTYS